MPIQICHISDPHFGSACAADVWNTVAAHLRIVQPKFLLLTGDVADSPKRDFFDAGHKEFEALQIPYMVVPGNHDRFTKGNKVGKWFGGLAGPAEYFDQVFGRSVAAANQVAEFTLSDGGYQRRLRIVGIDSCRHADYFARGYVDTADMESAKRALPGAKGTDLNIAMVHHHVLPVRALEEARRGLQTLASVTTLVNAGSLLESLSVADARLVLHGHEHMFNCAYYASPTADHEATCVIGAASITGNDSIEGCNISRAGYNYFELGDDGSITLEARRWTGGSFEPHFQTVLFSGGTVPQVEGSYSEDKLMKRLATASSVRMLVMRSESLFRRQAALLLRWIEERGLSMEVVLPDPRNAVLMEQLQTVYNTDAKGLATSIIGVVNQVRKDIFLRMKDQRKLTVFFQSSYPLYSAYLFDDQELWYFPYHFRPNAPDKAPLFIYPNAAGLSIYIDFRNLPTTAVDLTQAL